MHSCASVASPILGVNYCLPIELGDDRVFSVQAQYGSAAYECQRFKQWMECHYNVEVHTWDCIDYASERAIAAVYLDNTFHYFIQDKVLRNIPFEKRALVLEEPSHANPFFYFIPWARNRFKTVFTHSLRLLDGNPQYVGINVKVGGEPSYYAAAGRGGIPFSERKLLVAVSGNGSSIFPWTSHRDRRDAYGYFSRELPHDFDLYGRGWENEGLIAYKGPIDGTFDDKIATMSRYRFAICYENNVHEPGYVSEKIFDCFCARCVPIYYGSLEVDRWIPRGCYVDRREFRNLCELKDFLLSLTEDRFEKYLDEIEAYFHSPEIRFFSSDHFFDTIAGTLRLQKRYAAHRLRFEHN